MAHRKQQQEMEKVFKKVSEGREAFQGIYDKIQQTSNPAQKEKLEDNLKKEIKKLQRLRDQIKTWAAGNEIKDKKPLLEQRRLIESEMEKFKAVEKEMKTKAFSKEGLNAAAKMDPKEREKADLCQFLADMVEDLERQIETLEAEEESLQAGKKKKDAGKADRLSEIHRMLERHKWHSDKLERLLRAVENGNVEADDANDIKEGIEYYVKENASVDFLEDDTMYDDLNLDGDEGVWGANDADRVSSQDNQSVAEDTTDTVEMHKTSSASTGKHKAPSISDTASAGGRRPSTQLPSKPPLPALATLHTPLTNTANNAPSNSMKPAPPPTRPPGEALKYASAAAAAATNDRGSVGIAPLPPPPGAANMAPPLPSQGPLAGPVNLAPRTSAASSPAVSVSAPAIAGRAAKATPEPAGPSKDDKPPSRSQSTAPTATSGSIPPTPQLEAATASSSKAPLSQLPTQHEETTSPPLEQPKTPSQTGGRQPSIQEEEESIYHLPSCLQELISSYEETRSSPHDLAKPSPTTQRMLAASHNTRPDVFDADRPRHPHPVHRYNTPSYYPQVPTDITDDPSLYSRIDTDTLFFMFYYRQGTYEQLMSSRSLKNQSWRFHKQYQTWFQRHEEPKNITDEYEQGTYRFFDYESTWMNRRKADFKFAYKFLEDDM